MVRVDLLCQQNRPAPIALRVMVAVCGLLFAHVSCAQDQAPPTSPQPSAQLTTSAPRVTTRAHSFYDAAQAGDLRLSGKARSALAFSNKEAEVKALFDDAGLRFPPKEMLWRVFKEERVLEVWAAGKAGGEHTLIAAYEICSASGGPGPKRREGDGQVPEGFYTIDLFNSVSAYYLSMRVSYPNDSDKVLGYKPALGHSIMVHGSCVSIGCLAMSDERIQELWVMARRMEGAGGVVQAHLFPSRDLSKHIDKADRDGDTASATFWRNIALGFDHFESKRRLPAVSVNRKTGAYTFR